MKLGWMIGLIAGMLLSLGFVLSGCTSPEEDLPDTRPIAPTISVAVQSVQEGTLSKRQAFIGTISAEDSGTVYSQTAGTITKLHVNKGDSVTQGQAIGELDSAKQRLELRDAETKLAGAIARLNQAQASQSVGSVGTSRALAQQSLDHAKENVERVKRLVQEGALPAAQLDAAEEEWIRAQNSFRSTMVADAKDQAGVTVSATEVEAAKVGVEKAKRALQETTIRATMDGVINDLAVSVGDSITAQGAVAELVSLEQVKVAIQVSETDLSSFVKGEKVQVIIPALSEETEGLISFVGLAASRDTKLFPVEISLGNSSHILRPGMRADIKVASSNEQKGVLLPREAILEEDGRSIVYIVNADRAIKQEVEEMDGNEYFVLIKPWLSPGELVVVAGQEDLHDNARVVITNSNEKGE
ncbi:efflux RND transporter periplasmic adaptor subunit [Brevibacillus invocatus]|uniref:efflux RND transporter periplasmic adaptor subunit n=1 Tax=Brevibacillus invocatus TaxID=173959 RepID=UPI00203BDA21|nr:efflux RND transporter periplasmic adaptor subunit [Brevibacillus invocatus]MCM3080465.1 efflux RND transporter periplasmic adaptor subunit [Brevibacillus invocatus]MCM3430613.1 efflux RND transporter periplasmic adaptor subunit [Brevibacillus invocatus]